MKSLTVWATAVILASGFFGIGPLSSYADEAKACDCMQGGNMMNKGNMGSMTANSMQSMPANQKAELGASGYCPVCLLEGMAVKGDDRFTTQYKGKVYKFNNFDMQKVFFENPDQYSGPAVEEKIKELKK